MGTTVTVAITITAALVVGLVAALIFYKVGYNARRKKAEADIGSAEEEVKRIKADGAKAAETMKKEALLSAKEEIIRQRNEAEKEIKERRKEVSNQFRS